MYSIGLVANDIDGRWVGGRYYLQHLVKSVSLLPERERVPIVDVWWQEKPQVDPFAEVREHLQSSTVIRYPSTLGGRVRRKLRRMMNANRGVSDLFHQAQIGALFPSLICESPGVPFTYWLSDLNYLHWRNSLGEEEFHKWDERCRRSVKQADLIVLSSENAFENFKTVFPEAIAKVRVVHFCSVPDPTWWNLNPVEVAKSKGIESPYFLVSNQFNHYKNHGVIFEAVRVLRDRGMNVKLVCTGNTKGFAGEAYYIGLLEFIAANDLSSQIQILGLLPRDEHLAIMRGSAAMLQPSYYEGWSTAIEDAKALGKTILVSDLTVHREQLSPEYPFLISPDDASAWAEAMYTVCKAATLGPHLQDEARALRETKRQAQKTGRQFIRVMKEVMTV
jgi:glycosyltransferase involved in cell wall biosynthesis